VDHSAQQAKKVKTALAKKEKAPALDTMKKMEAKQQRYIP
jgi:hypothetical protein